MEENTRTEEVGVAVFGLGRAGGYHLPNLGSNPLVRVRWLVDVGVMEARAGELCGEHGLDHAVFVTTDQCHRVFEDQSTHAVIIATPTRFHKDIIKKAVKAGKHVFCEKPISFTAEEVRSCYDEAEKNGCVLFCAFNRRFEEHHVQLRDRVRAGQLGSLRVVHYAARDAKTSASYVRSYIHTSGGLFCDSAIHQLDFVVWLVGETPRSVFAVGGRTSDQASGFEECGDVDTTHITLQFPGGVLAHIEVLRETQPDFGYFRVEAVGGAGSYLTHKVTDTHLATPSLDGSGETQRSAMDFSSSHKRELDCFIRVVQGKEKCPITAEDVVLASRLADLCQVSLKEERLVKL